MKFFCHNLGIRALIIYFCFVLIHLINNYKKMFILEIIVIFVWDLCDDFYEN